MRGAEGGSGRRRAQGRGRKRSGGARGLWRKQAGGGEESVAAGHGASTASAGEGEAMALGGKGSGRGVVAGFPEAGVALGGGGVPGGRRRAGWRRDIGRPAVRVGVGRLRTRGGSGGSPRPYIGLNVIRIIF